tara:strand:+ start:2103 stop:2477 length:375 start_codon:yes stop_codon:yes gene_type:complete
MEAAKEKQEAKKNPIDKLKEAIEDKEEQIAILGTFIRLGVMVWAGFIISLNYITLPGIAKGDGPKDITFIASVFTGCLATFNVTPGGKKKTGKDGTSSTGSIPTQIIRIEQAPLKITTDTKKNV